MLTNACTFVHQWLNQLFSPEEVALEVRKEAVTAPVAGEAAASALPDISVKVQSFAYTAYGEQMGGVKVSGFTYNAEAYDAATGMLNLRARQYEPALNRFSQKDIYPANLLIPQSFNAYLFTYNSPVSFVDGDGLSAKSLGSVLSSIGSKVHGVDRTNDLRYPIPVDNDILEVLQKIMDSSL